MRNEADIRQAPPNRKLPALYVLDSVVKNVGTPYTLFFGRNLYQTFMNAYTLVDGPVRKKLEEMLKTWKEPVPGSLDTRPVFPPEVTRNIENALIKARTAAIQLQQQQARSLQGRNTASWRNTPTPPVVNSGMRFQNPNPVYPPAHSQQQYYVHQQESSIMNSIENGSSPALSLSIPQVRMLMPTSVARAADDRKPSTYSQQGASQVDGSPYSPPGDFAQFPNALHVLNNDLSSLVSVAQAEFATNPYDQAVQQRLKALLDLQTILQSQNLPPDQLKLIRAQVAQLSTASRPTPPLPVSTQYSSTQISSAQYPLSNFITQPEQPPQQTPQLQPSVQLQSLLSQNALAALFAPARSAQTPLSAAPTPPPSNPVPSQQQLFFSQQQAPLVSVTAASQLAGENPLLASLRAAGILPPTPTPPPATPLVSAITKPIVQPSLPLSMPQTDNRQVAASQHRSHYQPEPRPALAGLPNDVELTTASLKM